MLAQYKSINLIDRMDRRYQEHCKRMKFIRNCNRFIGETDYKQIVTFWLEAVIVKHLSKRFNPDKRSVLSWEELTSVNKYVRKYREIDGIFASTNGLIYLEVKASLSKSSYKRGKTQVNENLKLLASIDPNIKAVLAMADCRCYDPTFGFAKDFIEEQNTHSETYKIIEGLSYPDSFSDERKWLWLLNDMDIVELAKMYGPPHEDQIQEY